MSDTPKTDAAIVATSQMHSALVPVDFARAQERRIAELEEDKRKMRHALTLITDEVGSTARRIAHQVLGMVKP